MFTSVMFTLKLHSVMFTLKLNARKLNARTYVIPVEPHPLEVYTWCTLCTLNIKYE